MIDSGVLRRVGNAAAEGPALTRTGLEGVVLEAEGEGLTSADEEVPWPLLACG